MNKSDLESASFSYYSNVKEVDFFEKAKLAYEYIKHLKEKKHFNFRRVSMSGSGSEVIVVDNDENINKKMIYLASNDYFNLTQHPKTIDAGIKAIKKYGTGAGSVPLLGGTFDVHVELEEKIAKFKRCEDAIIYTSGFGSNCGSLLAMLDGNDLAVVDQLVHASLIDGCRNTNMIKFKHNDMDSLNSIVSINKDKYRMILIIVDGVYSMDGDICPLDKVVEIAKSNNAYVMVDEAHATGILGNNGRGTPEHCGVEGEVDIVAGTFSKALGSVGGFIAGKKETIESLRFFSRTYMFSTAMTPQSACSLIAAIDVMETEPQIRKDLWRNILFFREKLLEMKFNIGNSETAIFPIIIGDDYKTKEFCRRLHERGVYVNQVLYPAVSKELSRIRMSLMSVHTIDQLNRVLIALDEIGHDLEII